MLDTETRTEFEMNLSKIIYEKNLPFFTNKLCYRTELWTVNDHKITEFVNMIKSCELSIAKITGFSQKSSVCLCVITMCAAEGPSGYYLATSVLGLLVSSGITGNGDTGHCWLSPASYFCKPVADLTQTVRQESIHSRSPSYQGINFYQYTEFQTVVSWLEKVWALVTNIVTNTDKCKQSVEKIYLVSSASLAYLPTKHLTALHKIVDPWV